MFPPAGKALLVAGLLAFTLGQPMSALADRADRDKPVNLEADRVDLDDAKKEAVFVGNVTLTQGTLSIKADKIIVKQDAEGFQYGIAYGSPGKLANFRQKREGYDEYIEGFSERLEYDGKADKVQMFTNARIMRGGDEVRGDYISYNAVTEFYQVIAGKSTDRVRAVIQPKPKAGASAPPTGSVDLKPSKSVEPPKQ
ncbi:MAG TPA: lipopolysaccharide transport periplasmic protein LptA [Burkholderiales bacterium]|nr:lipopolysaccharide transport periplasmic protein LptA [Burkholderiales bacterium]